MHEPLRTVAHRQEKAQEKTMRQTKRDGYTITLNRKARTYTIRRYEHGRLVAKYRSSPQGEQFTEDWTENDIKMFIVSSGDYYIVKYNKQLN